MSLADRGPVTPGKPCRPEEDPVCTAPRRAGPRPSRQLSRRCCKLASFTSGTLITTDSAGPNDLWLLELGAVVVEVEPQQLANKGSLHVKVGRMTLRGTPMLAVGGIVLRDLQIRLVNIWWGMRALWTAKTSSCTSPQQQPDPNGCGRSGSYLCLPPNQRLSK